MTKYALIKDGVFLQSREFGSDIPPVLHPDKGRWVPLVVGAKPALNAATEKLVKTRTVNADDVTETWTAVALNAAELADIDKTKLAGAALKANRVLVSLVKTLLAKGTIAANDFPAGVRADYLAIKAIADRIEN